MNTNLEQYSGEQYYKRAPKLSLNVIQLDGDKGVFKLVKLAEKTGDTEYEKEELGKEIKGVVLRVRRRLKDFNTNLSTSEHNTPSDYVTLFEANKVKDRGIARDLREKYPALKTEQILYTLYEGELVKLVVKGSSLGSQNKPAGSVPWYEYLGSFPNSEHLWQFYTVLTAIQEQKANRTYYAISFTKGEKADKLEAEITENMKKLHDVFTAQDAYAKPRKDESAQLNKASKEPEIPVVSADDGGEIKPEEIPF